MEAFIASGGLPQFYQCGVVNHTQEEWYAQGQVHLVHGIACIVFGVTCQLLYLPCLFVLTQKDIIEITAYKLMLFITICDLLNLATNGLMTGFFMIDGAVYCNYPYAMYLWGCVEMASWAGGCIGCFTLVLTRLVDLISTRAHRMLFEGQRICVTFAILLSYMNYFLFYVKPILFNSRMRTWLYDPFIYADGRHYAEYACFVTIANNTGVVSLTLVLSILFFAVFYYKYKSKYNFSLNSMEKQVVNVTASELKQLTKFYSAILIQSCILSSTYLSCALIYVSFQFINFSPNVSLAGLVCWQLSSGGGLVVFYCFNRTIRRRILILVKLGRFAKDIRSLTHVI